MTPNFIRAKCAKRISDRTNDKIIIDNVMIEIRRAASIGRTTTEAKLTKGAVKILKEAGYEIADSSWFGEKKTCEIRWYNAY